MQGTTLRLWAICFCSAALPFASSGCALGPKALHRTHGPYYESLRTVHEEQFLRNIVHMRYNESPLALNVATINAQFEASAGAEARPFFVTDATSTLIRSFTRVLPFGQVSGTDRPTLTLDPADESETIRQFLTPIPADNLIFMTQTSLPISVVLRLWVDRLNGVPNGVVLGNCSPHMIAEHTRFRHAMDILQAAQDSGLIDVHAETQLVEVGGPLPASSVTSSALVEAARSNLEYRPSSDGKTWSLVRKSTRLVLAIRSHALNSPEVIELVQLLNLQPGESRYDIVVDEPRPGDPLLEPGPPSRTLKASPRSTAQVFAHLAHGVEVPAEHLRCGVVPSFVGADGQPLDEGALTQGLFAVHCSKGLHPPPNAYVAVRYRGFWYYVDDRDQVSKMTLGQMIQFSRLDFGRQVRSRPLLTLPTGR